MGLEQPDVVGSDVVRYTQASRLAVTNNEKLGTVGAVQEQTEEKHRSQMAFKLCFRVSPPLTPEAHKGKEMEPINNSALKAARRVLRSLNQMPQWFRHGSNKWILGGYRDISGSFHASLCSLLYVHNESVNIYSHLIPAIFLLLGQHYHASGYSGITGADFIAFSIFMLSAVTCLLLSAMYHIFMNHSQRIEHLCLRLDMMGVVIFILGDLILGVYMVFWCEPFLRKTYWSMIGALGTLAIFVTMHPKFQGPKYRLFRTLVFVATGLSGVAPLIHGINAFGMSQMMSKAFPYTLAKAGCLLFGTWFYVLIGYLDAFDYANTNITCSTL
ncbi:hypothetical protein FOXB_17820 [Fusarium oxysporum f. sp. conglutinans Fo5176]|uniref:ADIPOR-like receptor IZH2 n=1 Tax=Fusarium oxysporum (strain Fo5176) TaxID=660025 RepID=F9GGN6_FUSOF|nr:hypothetical protein FOXB_17820 [Fusarium oxysporum f. sp. conglutinans Fo5176]